MLILINRIQITLSQMVVYSLRQFVHVIRDCIQPINHQFFADTTWVITSNRHEFCDYFA